MFSYWQQSSKMDYSPQRESFPEATLLQNNQWSMGDTIEESIAFRSGKCRRCGFPIASHPACHSQTSCPGPVDALAQYSALDRPDLERHVHLLGFSGVPAQTRSGFWQLRLLGRYRHLALCSSARLESLQ